MENHRSFVPSVFLPRYKKTERIDFSLHIETEAKRTVKRTKPPRRAAIRRRTGKVTRPLAKETEHHVRSEKPHQQSLWDRSSAKK